MLKFEVQGDWHKTNSFLERALEVVKLGFLDKYGDKGVSALKSFTPKDTGHTADSWYYEIERKKDSAYIYWKNSNINDGVNIAIILQYGHGTGTGGYVQGTDYINPALRDIFDQIAEEAWEELTNE